MNMFRMSLLACHHHFPPIMPARSLSYAVSCLTHSPPFITSSPPLSFHSEPAVSCARGAMLCSHHVSLQHGRHNSLPVMSMIT